LFSDSEFRKQVAQSCQNETVRIFLLHEFARFSSGYRADGIGPIQNKVGAFLADPLLNRLLTSPQEDLHIRRIMDHGQVLLVNLGKGKIGEDSSSLLGGLLVTTIGLAAFSRADLPPTKRKDFYVYVDEFQSFTTLALINLLSELRKYRVAFTIAHQYLHQLDPEIRHAIFGNIGSVISFRVGAEDAPYIVQEFNEHYEKINFPQLANYPTYIKLMINGAPSKPFSARLFHLCPQVCARRSRSRDDSSRWLPQSKCPRRLVLMGSRRPTRASRQALQHHLKVPQFWCHQIIDWYGRLIYVAHHADITLRPQRNMRRNHHETAIRSYSYGVDGFGNSRCQLRDWSDGGLRHDPTDQRVGSTRHPYSTDKSNH
jgi:hypothetical protein